MGGEGLEPRYAMVLRRRSMEGPDLLARYVDSMVLEFIAHMSCSSDRRPE